MELVDGTAPIIALKLVIAPIARHIFPFFGSSFAGRGVH
jgi:hypothetical protein